MVQLWDTGKPSATNSLVWGRQDRINLIFSSKLLHLKSKMGAGKMTQQLRVLGCGGQVHVPAQEEQEQTVIRHLTTSGGGGGSSLLQRIWRVFTVELDFASILYIYKKKWNNEWVMSKNPNHSEIT